MLNNTQLRHFWAQIVSWAPRHARKTFIVLAQGLSDMHCRAKQRLSASSVCGWTRASSQHPSVQVQWCACANGSDALYRTLPVSSIPWYNNMVSRQPQMEHTRHCYHCQSDPDICYTTYHTPSYNTEVKKVAYMSLVRPYNSSIGCLEPTLHKIIFQWWGTLKLSGGWDMHSSWGVT